MPDLSLPPGPKPINPLKNLLLFRKDSLSFLKKISQEYGDIVRFKIGSLPVVYINHPDHIKEVLSTQNSNFVKGRPLELAKKLLGEGLLTSEGEYHKQHSRIMQPAFHRKMMEAYSPAMSEYANRLMKGWKDGGEVDMMKDMIQMSTGIAGKTLFSVDLEKDAPEINKSLESVLNIFGRITLPLSEWLLKIPLPGTIRFFKAKNKLDNTIYKIINDRKNTPQKNTDLLGLLLQAQEDPNGGFDDKQIRDEALTLLLTAFDTTSLALTWTWYLISQHPQIEAELHQELDRVLQGRTPSWEDYPKLEFTKMVFTESMRLYPPIYLIARQSIKPIEMGGYRIPAKTMVLISPYLIQRDSRFFQEPELFNPKTWSNRVSNQSSKYEYFPFSEGPRSCIGQHYAWLEGIMVLATIAQNWKIRLAPDQKVETSQLLNLRPKYGMRMQLFKRN
jgi:cytochrome P450